MNLFVNSTCFDLWHPHHLGHPQTHHLGHPTEFTHSPHFDASLRPPPNASLRPPMLILLTASTESDWWAGCRGGTGSFYPWPPMFILLTASTESDWWAGCRGGTGSFYHCLKTLIQPFRVWLRGVRRGHSTSSLLDTAI